jgi:diguanylate cyclase (GGDEF)-like protein
MRRGRRLIIWIRLAICALVALLSIWPALAASSGFDAGRVCVLSSNDVKSPERLFDKPGSFDCNRLEAGDGGRFTYRLITGLSLQTNPADPWELRHGNAQVRHQIVFVRYSDGKVVRAPSDESTARRVFSSGTVGYELPSQPGTITAVLIAAESLQNQRGIAADARFMPRSDARAADFDAAAVYGLLGGGIIALLIYNLGLFAALRYSFVRAYCLSAMAMLATGFCWSGAIFLVVPGLETTTQISLILMFTALTLATSASFMLTFIEPQFLPRSGKAAITAFATIGVALGIVRVFAPHFLWRLIDYATYASMLALLLAVAVTAVIARKRGSRAASVYIFAWIAPIGLAIGRVFWGMGLIGGSSALIAASPMAIMAMEALMSALAVTWRIGLLRDERDTLKYFAETDVLTGLLNRRAFIAKVQAIGADGGRHRLIVADVDRFKLVNDRYGHQAGDDVLIRVATVLRATATADAIIGRIGGEEFALLVPAEPVDALADRLRRAVAASATRDEIAVTISAGVADGSCRDDGDWRRLYYAADQALYRAKNGGRNRVSTATETLVAA